MKKLSILLILSMGTMLWANMPNQHHLDIKKHVQNKIHNNTRERQQTIKERNLTHKKTRKRTFRTAKEFKDHKRRFNNKKHIKSLVRGTQYTRDGYRNDRYSENRRDYRYNTRNSRGYRHYRDSWYEAYRYERASFYDRHGYHYGYFNRKGYMFEGEFYRYDRSYTYRDRMRGKELFGHRYYRPIVDYYSYNDYAGYNNRY